MRLVTGISIVSLVISVVTLALVLMLFVTKEPKESFDAQMTRYMLYDLISHHVGNNSLDKHDRESKTAWACLDHRENYHDSRHWGVDPPAYKDGKWTIQANGLKYCDGIETFTVDVSTGEVTHVLKPR